MDFARAAREDYSVSRTRKEVGMTPDHGALVTHAHNGVLRAGLGSQEIEEVEHKPTMTCRIDRLVTGQGLEFRKGTHRG